MIDDLESLDASIDKLSITFPNTLIYCRCENQPDNAIYFINSFLRTMQDFNWQDDVIISYGKEILKSNIFEFPQKVKIIFFYINDGEYKEYPIKSNSFLMEFKG